MVKEKFMFVPVQYGMTYSLVESWVTSSSQNGMVHANLKNGPEDTRESMRTGLCC